MKKFRLITTLFALAIATMVGFQTHTADAQIVLVDSKYRVVEVDKFENRISVALPDADPDVGQTWVDIDSDTRGSVRSYYGSGLFRDEQLTPEGILNAAEARKGQLIKINGGRDWDGSITAKTVWM